jgi:type II secretory pathway predicted ATPase ExeA
MTPQAALEQQIGLYRAMSGEERLSIALNLHELACEVTREGIRHEYPEIDEAEVNRLLRERLELARHL